MGTWGEGAMKTHGLPAVFSFFFGQGGRGFPLGRGRKGGIQRRMSGKRWELRRKKSSFCLRLIGLAFLSQHIKMRITPPFSIECGKILQNSFKRLY